MPTGAHQQCLQPICREYAVSDGYCAQHATRTQRMPEFRRRDKRLSNLKPCNRQFKRMRHSYLLRHPVCAMCQREPAGVLDHITPHRGVPDLFWDRRNWQGLCIRCHGIKSARETWGRFPNFTPENFGGHVPARDSWGNPKQTGSEKSGRLIVTMGAPGCGKSTYAEKFPYVVTTDALRANGSKAHTSAVFRQAFDTLREWLRMGREVVFDTTANSSAIREQAIRVARDTGATATLVLFPTDVGLCVARQAGRVHPVPESQVRNIHASIREQFAIVSRESWDSISVNGAPENADRIFTNAH